MASIAAQKRFERLKSIDSHRRQRYGPWLADRIGPIANWFGMHRPLPTPRGAQAPDKTPDKIETIIANPVPLYPPSSAVPPSGNTIRAASGSVVELPSMSRAQPAGIGRPSWPYISIAVDRGNRC